MKRSILFMPKNTLLNICWVKNTILFCLILIIHLHPIKDLVLTERLMYFCVGSTEINVKFGVLTLFP